MRLVLLAAFAELAELKTIFELFLVLERIVANILTDGTFKFDQSVL